MNTIDKLLQEALDKLREAQLQEETTDMVYGQLDAVMASIDVIKERAEGRT